MAPKREGEVITEFLKELMPPGTMEAYDLLARLDYPIHDKKSLSTVLEAEKNRTSALSAMLNVLEAADFPLSSARNALEKLTARLTPQPFLNPFDDPRVGLENPNFGDDACGLAANELYQSLLPFQVRGTPADFATRLPSKMANLCRLRIPDFDGICSGEQSRAWAESFVRTNDVIAAARAAERAKRSCIAGFREASRFGRFGVDPIDTDLLDEN